MQNVDMIVCERGTLDDDSINVSPMFWAFIRNVLFWKERHRIDQDKMYQWLQKVIKSKKKVRIDQKILFSTKLEKSTLDRIEVYQNFLMFPRLETLFGEVYNIYSQQDDSKHRQMVIDCVEHMISIGKERRQRNMAT